MSKKIMLLALAAVSAAMFALPAVASAETWHITKAEKFTVNSTGHAGPFLSLKGSALRVECASVDGSGEYENTTTGKDLTLVFHGCKESVFKTACTGTAAGEPSGTIKTTALTFHNIMLEATTPGVLITPNGTHFASFKCIDGTHVVSGNGIVGDLSSPACGASSKTATLNFETTEPGVQKWMQTNTTGTKFDLTNSTNGGGAVTAGQSGTGTIVFPNAQTVNCTP